MAFKKKTIRKMARELKSRSPKSALAGRHERDFGKRRKRVVYGVPSPQGQERRQNRIEELIEEINANGGI